MIQIEEVIVDKDFRGLGLGVYLMDKAKEIAKESNAYRIIGNCGDKLVSFYESCGFKIQGH